MFGKVGSLTPHLFIVNGLIFVLGLGLGKRFKNKEVLFIIFVLAQSAPESRVPN